MRTLMIQQSKISRTKRKLSSSWQLTTLTAIAVFTVFAALSYAMRALNLSWRYSSVPVTIPVQAPDGGAEALARFADVSRIEKTTVVVAITESAIFFGRLQAFTDEYFKKTNKYMVPHLDQRPNLKELLETMKKWEAQENSKPMPSDPLLVIPSSTIPMPIVTQTLGALRRYGPYEQIILAEGLL